MRNSSANSTSPPGEGADRGHVIVGKRDRAAAQFGLIQLAGDMVDCSALGGDLRAPGLQVIEHDRIGRAQQDVSGPHQTAQSGGVIGDAAPLQSGVEVSQFASTDA